MTTQAITYEQFLKNKVIISESYGFEPTWMPEIAFPHQRDISTWSVQGGRRAVFANFGLGKTFIQLIIGVNVIKETDKPFLIACPLGVVGEFKRDNQKLSTGYEIEYITDSDSIDQYDNKIYLTNYERIRKGDIDPLKFGGVSFDEASILRNLKTQTTQYILSYFKQVPYRFVATATPTPNDYIEILNYADFLGIADRGHLLTRFFKRNSTKAGDLTLLDSKKKEFWQWVSTWSVFLNKPSDLGYDDNGYILPEMIVNEHLVENLTDDVIINKRGEIVMFKNATESLIEASREKRDSIEIRLDKAVELAIINSGNSIIWHHLEPERKGLEKRLKGEKYRSVYGSQKNSLKENNLIDFSEGNYRFLLTKPEIAGSGCNFQDYCSTAIFAGINYKFNDFIQAIHRIYRFGQNRPVNIHIIYTENEQHIFKKLMDKWGKHKELQSEMIALVKEYGLNNDMIKSQMERQIFKNGDKIQIGNATLYNNDNVNILNDKKEIKDNSVGLIVTSIPFGDHYEYSDNYNDFGHNDGNEEFFKQMNFLTPNLLRVLQPGRICAVHVKDRIRYSYQNGTSFTTIDDFSGQTVAHFVKHGFYLMGKITVTTDVVAENNQTYRLGWSENAKDSSKMGVGLPEYILIFRKAPSELNNAYADDPVKKSKDNYSVAQWQLDAHAYWRSSGDVLMNLEDLNKHDLKHVIKAWKQFNKEGLYDFNQHVGISEQLDKNGKLSRKFMTLPPQSNSDLVWDDVRRTDTLNAKQTNKKKEKHICPLQLDIIDRLIRRYSNENEIILDPFGGLMSVPYYALKMNRKSIGIELNSEYYKDGLFYVKSMFHKMAMPTLFDVEDIKQVS